MSEPETKASQIAGLIPQVFYDLIGRIAPGAFLLTLAFLRAHWDDWRVSVAPLFAEPKIPYSLLLIVGVLLSYMSGVLLGGIGYFIADELKLLGCCFENWRRHKTKPCEEPDIREPSVSYDAIQYYDPAAGARLVKLSAERNMCRVLIAGFILLEIGHRTTTEFRTHDLATVLLGFGAVSAFLFHRHLTSRSQELMKNLRYILEQEGKRAFLPTDMANRGKEYDGASVTETKSTIQQKKPDQNDK